jgi:hypothetical protein
VKKLYGLSFALLLALPALALAAATAAWTPPTLNTDGSTITAALTYNLYQGTQVAGVATVLSVQTGITTATVTVTAGLTAGSTQCFAVTAVEAGQESGMSPQACVLIPLPKPNAPTSLTITLH